MPCKAHGWHSEQCPECLYKNSKSEDTDVVALQIALYAIRATRAQAHLLILLARDVGYPEAFDTARNWQNPLPLPSVQVCAGK
jgi:hypothetical protein